jgi:hypothetical protein
MPRHSKRQYSESFDSSDDEPEISVHDYMVSVPKCDPSCWEIWLGWYCRTFFTWWGICASIAVSGVLLYNGVDTHTKTGNIVTLMIGGVFTLFWVVCDVILTFIVGTAAADILRAVG